MNYKIQYEFTNKRKKVWAYSFKDAKAWAQKHPDNKVKIYDRGKLIDECLASDCFNIEPKEHEG